MRQYLKEYRKVPCETQRFLFLFCFLVVKENSGSLRRLNGVLASKKSAELFWKDPLAAEQIQLPVNLTLKTTLDEILYNLFLSGLLDVGLCSLTDFSFREILY